MNDSVSKEDFSRLEAKVDDLNKAVSKLILFEERQANQGARIGDVEKSIAVLERLQNDTDRKVEKWINMGMGAWAVAAVLFTIFQLGAKFVK